MRTTIDAQEAKVLFALLAFSIVWIALVIPFITSNSMFLSLNPVISFFLFNLGFLLISIAIFGTILSMTIDQDFNWKNAFKNGLLAFLSFSFCLDIWSPPFAIDAQGNELISNSATGINAAGDRMWAYIFNSLFPWLKPIQIPVLNMSLLFVATYALVPLLMAVIAAIIFSKGKFFKWLNIGGVQNVQ